MPNLRRISHGSSPHTRGARAPTCIRRRRRGIIPAYAGSTPTAALGSGLREDHPRIRGEHASVAKRMSPVLGSSPHTRGAQHQLRITNEVKRIIPAYAGSTLPHEIVQEMREDHPRIRGEHGLCDLGPEVQPGSSPHTRGARADEPRHRRRQRIIPAYAGSTVSASRTSTVRQDHPRIRGEHYLPKEADIFEGGSSPHTRGAPSLKPGVSNGERIIPAYAGSTRHRQRLPRVPTDHPRIRGEHGNTDNTTKEDEGSSPHTRGAHLEIPAIPRIAAVIIPVFLYPSPTPQEEADRSMVLLTLS